MGCKESKTKYQTNPEEKINDNIKSPPSQEITVENTDGKVTNSDGKPDSDHKKNKNKGQKEVSDVKAKRAVSEERNSMVFMQSEPTKPMTKVSAANLNDPTKTHNEKKSKQGNSMVFMQSEPTKPMTKVSAANSNDPTKTHNKKKSKQGNNNVNVMNTVSQPGPVTQPEVKSDTDKSDQQNAEIEKENHDGNQNERNSMASTQSERTKSMTEMPAANLNDLTKTHEEKKNKKVPGNSHVSVINIVSQPGSVIPPEVKSPTVTSDEQITQIEKENHDENQNERNSQENTTLDVDKQTVGQSGEIMPAESAPEKQDIQLERKGKETLTGYVEKLESLISSTSEPIRPDRKLEKENKELKKEVQEKEGMLEKLKKDMEEKKNKITELEEEIKETHDRANKNMKHKSERIATRDSKELGKLKRELTNIKTENDDIKSKMKDMEKENDAAVAKKVKEIRNLEKEKDELLCRLSEMAGRRLTDNNPNIADLSDLNRPTKLAEKYAELYDNDWTDAYSYLETLDAYKDSEVTVIAALMTMLTTAYKMSLETSESQLEELRHILSDFQGSIQHQDQQVKDIIKQLKDQRKRAVQPSKVLTEKYRKEIEKAFPKLDSSIFESDSLKPYLQKCLELCWLMAIQDPPVHLKCDGCKKGELFDKSMYKEYTKAGRLIIYSVWPAVFLEKDGALLCKGVVQCDKRLSSSLRVAQGTTSIPVSRKSSSLRATGTQPLTTFPAKDNISDKIDGGTTMETKRDNSEKRNSKTVYVKL